jgi:hypothetical protein
MATFKERDSQYELCACVNFATPINHYIPVAVKFAQSMQ